jgi:2-polyprenyl-6-methoxyphenol hydroxylase-like FAD-dependent oxidoreductase
VNVKTEILIVGGGIGGVVLAELLTRVGKAVLIIERATSPPPFLRPELLWPSAVQTLFSLRDRIDWERDSFRPVGGIILDRRGRLQPVVTPKSLHAAGIQPYFENPNQTRETLLAHCQADVRRGIEVVEIVREDGIVRGVRARERASGETLDVSADLTVGDDGTDSLVRTQCGIEISLKPFPVDFFVSGLPWPKDWAPDIGRIIFTPRDDDSGLFAAGFLPVPGSLAATVAVAWADRSEDSAGLSRGWNSMLATASSAPGEIRAADFPGSFTKIGRRWGHAVRYGVPGAVLIGDALHPVSPAGGQGANMAINDAVAVARLIIAGAPDLERSYESARRAPNERGLRPTRLAARMFAATRQPALSALFGFLLPRLIKFPGVVPTILRNLANGSANPA